MMQYLRKIFEIGDEIAIYCYGRELRGTIEIIDDRYIVIRSLDNQNTIGINASAISYFSKEPIRNKVKREHSVRNYSKDLREEGYTDWNGQRYDERQPQLSHEAQLRNQELIKKEKQFFHEVILLKQQVREEAERLFIENQSFMDTLVPANGVIVQLKNSFQFGFIDDKSDGTRFFFNKGDLIDPNLSNFEGEYIDVIFKKTRNQKGPAAKNIHLAGTVRDQLNLIITHLETGAYFDAYAILENVFVELGDPSELQEVMRLLTIIIKKAREVGYELKGKSVLYSEARKCLQNKDYDEALDLYFECMRLGIRKDNCIKDILQIYITTYAQKQNEEERAELKRIALDFLEEHRDELPREQSTNFTFENAYFALGEYEKHIEVAEDIVTECGRNGELPQYVFYLNKLAQSYFRIGELEKALDAVYQGLDIEPQNQHLLKTMSSIRDEMNRDSDSYYMQ